MSDNLCDDVIELLLLKLPTKIMRLLNKKYRDISYVNLIIKLENIRKFDILQKCNILYSNNNTFTLFQNVNSSYCDDVDKVHNILDNLRISFKNYRLIVTYYNLNREYFIENLIIDKLELYDNSMIDLKNIVNPVNLLILKPDFGYSGVTYNIHNIPISTKKLEIHHHYISKRIDKFPTYLTNFALHSDFNYELDDLPQTVEYLIITGNSRISQNYSYLKNLKFLSISGNHMEITGLPDSLLHLNYYVHSPYPLNKLPSKLKILNLSGSYIHKFHKLPEELKKLTIYTNSKHHGIISLYDSELPECNLTYFNPGPTFNRPFSNLPVSLTKLVLGENYTHNINAESMKLKILYCKGDCEILNLGNYLTELHLTGKYCKPLPKLPDTLELLELGNEFNCELENLPLSLKKLELGIKFDKKIDSFPENIEHIIFSDAGGFKQNIFFLPKNIISIRLPTWYEGKINLTENYKYFNFIYFGAYGTEHNIKSNGLNENVRISYFR